MAPLCLQDVEKLADSILKSVLTLTTVYYWLPKSHGKSALFNQYHDESYSSCIEKYLPLIAPSFHFSCFPGVSLRRQVRAATVEVLDGVSQLLEIILSSPLQRCLLLIFKLPLIKHTRHTSSLSLDQMFLYYSFSQLYIDII